MLFRSDAVHTTAGHNALRGSGPGQKRAFDDAMALACRWRSRPQHHKRIFSVQADYAFSTGGGVHVPLRIEGAFFLGQYIRSMAMKSPFGAGNQFDSLSAPGDSFWK